MFENSAIKIAASKVVSASSPYIPGTLILLSGVVVWKLWQKQSKLQTQSNELSNELKAVKRQVAKIKTEKPKETKKAASEQVAALSSSFKNLFNR